MKKQLLALALAVDAGQVAQAPPGARPTATPCPYHYPATSRPACVGGHTDRLVPIVYGRPTPQAVRQAKQGNLVLRGCLVSDCDPRYYCPVHKRDL